jgi:pimeloyl-ACP methyl ester carboxylesterase
MPQRKRVFLLLLVLCLSGGCTQFRSFRPVPADGQPTRCKEGTGQSCASSPLIETPEYLLGFVELDDLGWFWDRKQKQAVVDAVRETALEQDVAIVVFAHGWNHDSDARDGNVLKFQQILGRLARVESEAARLRCLQPRRVVGVYMGWRGKAFKGAGHLPATLYNWTSFFSRKATAHRVGAEDAAELLSDLDRIRAEASGAAGRTPNASRMVVVGHSFGTAVVYGAISRILAERRIHLADGGVNAASFGDLVVLVNPAIEASLLVPFEQATESYNKSEKRESSAFHPILAVFASQGDGPNRFLFPVARTLSTLFKRHRSEAPPSFTQIPHFQGKAVRHAVGQFEPTISLLLCPAGETRDGRSLRCTRTTKASSGANENGEIDWQGQEKLEDQIDSLRAARSLTDAFQKGERTELPLSTSSLFRLKPGPMTPYPIVTVDGRLIRDHNDIFTDFFAPFLIDFISVWTPPRGSICAAEPVSSAPESREGARP